jgi:hypothetical protein
MQVDNFIVCDDIRFEMGNKMSIMGIYDDTILIPSSQQGVDLKWPLPMRLAFFIRLYLLDPTSVPNRFEFIVIHEAEKIASVEGELSILDVSKPLRLAISVAQLPMPKPGNLSFKLVFKRDSEVIAEKTDLRQLTIGIIGLTQEIGPPQSLSH